MSLSPIPISNNQGVSTSSRRDSAMFSASKGECIGSQAPGAMTMTSFDPPPYSSLRKRVTEIGKTDPQTASVISSILPAYRGTPTQMETLNSLGIKTSDLPEPPRLFGGMLAAENLVVGVGKFVAKKAIQLLIDGNKEEVEGELKKEFVPARIQLPNGKCEEGHHKGGRVLSGGEKEHFYSVRRYFAEATGLGSFISAKARYEGEFLRNVFHDLTGQAKFYIEAEERYTGCFREGKRAGPGSLEKYSRELGDFYLHYRGTWMEDQPETGTFFSPDQREVGWIQNGKSLQSPPAKAAASAARSISHVHYSPLSSSLHPSTKTAPFATVLRPHPGGGSPSLNLPSSEQAFANRQGPELLIYERYPNPDENPLISAQLRDPNRPLPVEDRVALLTQCIQYGRLQAKKASGKNILLFIGNTGAGKSTTANYFAGCTMETQMPEGSIASVMAVVPPERGGTLAEIMPIGHSKVSKTFMPHIETPPGTDPMTYCDCPGFLDNRGAEINIANAVNIRSAIKQAASVRVIILINYFTLLADRGRGLKDVLKICANLFGKPENLIANKSSILFGVTNSPLEMTLSSLKKWISEDSVPFMADLLDRLFFFDPLDRGTEGTGRWTRQKCLESISQLKPVPSHDKIFSTVLTDGDENALVQLSEEIGNNIDKALRAKNFALAAEQLQSLEDLSIIEHIVLERLIRSQAARIESYLTKYANQFKTHCSMDRFVEAKAVWGELQSILSHFPKLASFLENEQLQEHYNGCYEKYERAQKKEEAFQKLLMDAEARSERSESHIREVMLRLEEQKQEALAHHAEQERQYLSHIQQLQMQIEKITRSYEQAKLELENERKEREAKIAEKIEELTKLDRLQEAAELANIRNQLQFEYEGRLQEADGDYSLQLQEQEELKIQVERDQKLQEEKLAQELAKIQAQTAEQEKAMAAARELEREKLRQLAKEDAARLRQEGDALHQQSQFSEALEKYRESLSRLEMVSPRSIDVATCLYSIGCTHQQLANLPAALECYQKASSIWESLSSNSPDLAMCHYNMGQVYQAQKELAKALESYRKCLVIRTLISRDRLDVARCHEKLGQVYQDQGELDQSKEQYLKSIAIRMNFAPESLETAAVLNHLGSVYHASSDFSKELDQYQISLPIQQKLAPDSLDTATTYHNMGRALQSQNRLTEALEYYQRSCLIRERLAPRSLDLSVTYHYVGSIYHDQKLFPQALEQYQKCQDIEEALIPDSVAIAMTYNNMGRVYAAQNRLSEALEQFQKSLKIKEQQTPDSLAVATTSHNIGLIYQSQGDEPKAFAYFQKSLAILQRVAPNSTELAASYQCVGSTHSSLKNFPEALRHILQSLELYKKLNPDSLATASAHESARRVYCDLQIFSHAIAHQQQCLKIRERLIPESLDLADTYFAQGDLLVVSAKSGIFGYRDKLSEALTFYQQCLAIREAKNAGAQAIAACYDRIGNIYHAIDKLQEAAKCYHKSFEIRFPVESSESAPRRSPISTPELTTLIQRAGSYSSSDRSDKMIAVCELQVLLVRLAGGLVPPQTVLTYIDTAFNKADNPIFEASMFRKSVVKMLFENTRDYIKSLPQ